jgi:hypothetical protein
MGMICLEILLVMGYKRVPDPPARIIPFIINGFYNDKIIISGD